MRNPEHLRVEVVTNGPELGSPQRRLEDRFPGVPLVDILPKVILPGAQLNVPVHPRDVLQPKIEAWLNSGKGVAFFDWDGFITIQGQIPGTERQQSTVWQEVKTLLGFSPELQSKMLEHYKTYGRSKDINEQIEWSDLTYAVYREHGVTATHITHVARQIEVRPGAIDQIQGLLRAGKRVVIVSYGIKDIIDHTLHAHGLHRDVTVYADTLEFDEAGVVRGADPNVHRVVGGNKGLYLDYDLDLNNVGRDTPVLVGGDSLHDLDLMASAQQRGNQGIGIYLEHTGHKMGSFTYGALEEVGGYADIIAVNQADVSFEPVARFIRRLIG